MNKKIGTAILATLIITSAIVFSAYALFNDNSALGVSTFSNNDISFKYPSIWSKQNNNNFYLSLWGLDRSLDLDIIDNMSNDSFEYQIEILSNNNSTEKYIVLKVNQTQIDGQKAYEINSKFDKKETYYCKFLAFQYKNKLYLFAFTYKNLNTITNDFNLVKNSIQLN